MPIAANSANLWRVLVVEDEALIAEEIQDRLVRMGCQVAGVADTGPAAIELARTTMPDLVLMDIRLKGPMDGIEAAQQIFRNFDTPVVFLTAHSDQATFQRTHMESTFGYLLKPFHARDLSVAMALAVSRFRTDQRVRESEHIHATIVNSIADAALVIDTDGRIRSLNRAAATLTGWDLGDAVGRHVEQVLVLAGESTGFRMENPAIQALRDNVVVPIAGPLVLFDRQGASLPVEGNAAPLVDSGGRPNGALVILRDITKRRLAEQKLRQSHAHLEVSQHIARVGSWEVDLDFPSDLDANPARWSDQCYRLFGYQPSQAELARSSFSSRIHSEDRAGVRAAFYDAIQAGGVFEIEHRVVLEGGQERIIHERAEPLLDPASGKPVRYVGTAQDVTDQRCAERSLRESEARLRAVVEGMPVLLMAFAGQQTVAWNRECERVTGYSVEDIVGNPRVGELLNPDPAYRQKVMEAFERTGGDTRCQQWTLKCKDGTRKTIEWSSVSNYLPIPGWTMWIVGVDVTERLKLEEDLRHAHKMQALGQLAGGVAHDFNNLLTVINGYSNMLFDNLAGQEALQQKAEHIRKAGSTAAAITDQLLAFSQKRVVQPEILDLNRVVEDYSAILKELLGEKVVLNLDLTPGLHPVLDTVTSIQRVLMNLAANARDAMSGRGQLRIATANMIRQEPGEPSPVACVRLTVQDYGYGISKEDLENLFEPFFTTKEAGKHTGLGLATVYGLVKQRGGWVEVESELGLGATFHVYLPAVQRAATGLGAAHYDAAEYPPITILLAEDDAAVRDLCVSVLESHGSTVLIARDGAEALEVAGNHRGRIDLLVSDIAMPKLTGLQLFEQLKHGGRNLPVLFISGNPDEAMPLGSGVGLLPKPFVGSQLMQAIARTLKPS